MTDDKRDASPEHRLRNDSREPIWSVPPGWGRPCFAAFCLLTVAFTAYLAWYDLDGKANVGAKEIIATVILSLLPGGGAAAVSVIILAEVMQYTMSTLEYLRNKWVKPLIARHRADGRAQGRAEMYDELRKWLERREVAEQAGSPFYEPPPTPDKKD